MNNSTIEQPGNIPYGYCQCGCGQQTKIARRNSSIHGMVKGEPMRYISGHNMRKPAQAAPKLCACGCGGIVRSQRGQFCRGHSSRVRAVRPVTERFWEKVSVGDADQCWLWNGTLTPLGYGTIRVGSKSDGTARHLFAHRLSYELHHGPIPDGFSICHRCDNPRCVNPSHLFVGSHQTNMRDMVKKGRNSRGARNGQARLTVDQVREIRAMAEAGDTHAAIAERFGITRSAVSQIVERKRWAHVR